MEVLKGFHNLCPYAGAFWKEHITALAKSHFQERDLVPLRNSIELLTKNYKELISLVAAKAPSETLVSQLECLWNMLDISTESR